MFILAHLAIGLLIGKLTNNYEIAIIGSLFVDLDHLISYAKNGVIFNFKKFWKTVTNPHDPYGNQRHFLHNLWVLKIVAVSTILINPTVGFTFTIAYAAHLILDSLDSSDFKPLVPLSKRNVKGPIRYLSHAEIAITTCMFFIFIII